MISIVERGKAERYEQVVLCGDSTVEDIINKLDLQFGSFEFYETSGKRKKTGSKNLIAGTKIKRTEQWWQIFPSFSWKV